MFSHAHVLAPPASLRNHHYTQSWHANWVASDSLSPSKALTFWFLLFHLHRVIFLRGQGAAAFCVMMHGGLNQRRENCLTVLGAVFQHVPALECLTVKLCQAQCSLPRHRSTSPRKWSEAHSLGIPSSSVPLPSVVDPPRHRWKRSPTTERSDSHRIRQQSSDSPMRSY